jgi:phytoene desaturase
LNQKVVVIGCGFAGLSVATFLAKADYDVTVLEKHSTPGGRARQLKAEGFTFDMGPSWYWMPDVFERYFNQFNKKVSEYYSLKRLNPSYKIYWEDEAINIPAEYSELKNLFERIERGSANQLDKFLQEAEYKYEIGINKLVHKPGQSFTEFFDWNVIKGIFKLDVFNSMKSHVAKHFSNKKIKEILEFPVLFLGALPEKIPALYSLMNYADIKDGTWYPEKGMYSIVNAMYDLAEELGVKFCFNEEVKEIVINDGKADKIKSFNFFSQQQNFFYADVVISSADYHFTETKLLPTKYMSYNKAYWDSRVMAPSCLLYYVGLNKKLKNIVHHSLFFDADFQQHGEEIYVSKQFPQNPLFYVSSTSVTDELVAPPNCENLFILIPVAAGLQDTDEIKEKYFDIVIERMEKQLKQSIKQHIIYKNSFACNDFVNEYNAFKGNAYGLANTLLQTSIFKPSCRSKKVKNLFYTGQLTVPGPGVPPSLISGEVVAKQVMKYFS